MSFSGRPVTTTLATAHSSGQRPCRQLCPDGSSRPRGSPVTTGSAPPGARPVSLWLRPGPGPVTVPDPSQPCVPSHSRSQHSPLQDYSSTVALSSSGAQRPSRRRVAGPSTCRAQQDHAPGPPFSPLRGGMTEGLLRAAANGGHGNGRSRVDPGSLLQRSEAILGPQVWTDTVTRSHVRLPHGDRALGCSPHARWPSVWPCADTFTQQACPPRTVAPVAR